MTPKDPALAILHAWRVARPGRTVEVWRERSLHAPADPWHAVLMCPATSSVDGASGPTPAAAILRAARLANSWMADHA